MKDMKKRDLDRAMVDHAASRYGLITIAEARKLGLTAHMLATRVTNGQLWVVGRGLYRLAGTPATWEQRVLATCLLGGTGAVASHRAAAVLWEIGQIRPGRAEVCVPKGRSARRAARLGRVHHSFRLADDDVTTCKQIPVTTPARTVVDLAGDVSRSTLVNLVDDVVCNNLATLDDLDKCLGRLGRNHPGKPAFGEVRKAWTPGPNAGSAEEMRVVRSLVERGIPEPRRQHEVFSEGKLVARMDFAWPAEKVGLELQSLRWHGTPERFHTDRVRLLHLRSLGWDVVEVTPRLMHADGGALLHRAVTAALTRAPRTTVGSQPCQ
jgi:hypothetical protein